MMRWMTRTHSPPFHIVILILDSEPTLSFSNVFRCLRRNVPSRKGRSQSLPSSDLSLQRPRQYGTRAIADRPHTLAPDPSELPLPSVQSSAKKAPKPATQHSVLSDSPLLSSQSSASPIPQLPKAQKSSAEGSDDELIFLSDNSQNAASAVPRAQPGQYQVNHPQQPVAMQQQQMPMYVMMPGPQQQQMMYPYPMAMPIPYYGQPMMANAGPRPVYPPAAMMSPPTWTPMMPPPPQVTVVQSGDASAPTPMFFAHPAHSLLHPS